MQSIKLNRAVKIILYIFASVLCLLIIINILDYVSVFGLNVIKDNIQGMPFDGWVEYHYNKNNYIVYNIIKIPNLLSMIVIILHFTVVVLLLFLMFVVFMPIAVIINVIIYNKTIFSIILFMSIIVCCFCCIYNDKYFLPDQSQDETIQQV